MVSKIRFLIEGNHEMAVEDNPKFLESFWFEVANLTRYLQNMYLFVMACIKVSKSTYIGVGGLILKKTVIFKRELANEKKARRVREVTTF
jgi:hypothetical protein